MRHTILLANNNQIISQRISAMLLKHPSYKVISVCSDGIEAEEFILEHKPNIAILDESLHNNNGLAIAKHLKQEGLKTKLALLSSNCCKEQMRSALEFGVLGYFSVKKLTKQMFCCLETIGLNKHFIDKDLLVSAN